MKLPYISVTLRDYKGFRCFLYRFKDVCGYNLPGNYKVLHLKWYWRYLSPEVEQIRSTVTGNGGMVMSL
jgi:hypothetical protein